MMKGTGVFYGATLKNTAQEIAICRRLYMGRRSIIWGNNLEGYVKYLHFEQRKNYSRIAEIIRKEKQINISREAIRTFLNNEKNTEKLH
jgi:hypothetical protein